MIYHQFNRLERNYVNSSVTCIISHFYNHTFSDKKKLFKNNREELKKESSENIIIEMQYINIILQFHKIYILYNLTRLLKNNKWSTKIIMYIITFLKINVYNMRKQQLLFLEDFFFLFFCFYYYYCHYYYCKKWFFSVCIV